MSALHCPSTLPADEADAILPGGASVHIRPIRASDLAMHVRFVAGLSAPTRYARLLSMRQPGIDELKRWTDIDRSVELALVATVLGDEDEQEIGVARYVREAGGDGHATAAVAVVIADAWHRMGVARELMQRLIAGARRDGIEVLSDVTQYDNRAMLTLARKLGFRLQRPAADGANLTRVTLRLGD